jgi:hypothetical protein
MGDKSPKKNTKKPKKDKVVKAAAGSSMKAV